MRNNHFNLMRMLFASMVIWSHVPEIADGNRYREPLTMLFHNLSFGEFAVNCFFLLSGFLIVQSWHFKPDAILFLEKRLLRIYPGFIVASLICGLLIAPLAGNPQYFDQLNILHFVASTITLGMPAIPTVFPGTHYADINDSMWTIRYEFACYLLVLLIGLLSKTGFRLAWAVATLVIVVLNVSHEFFHWLPSHNIILRLPVLFSVGGLFFLYPTLRKPGVLKSVLAIIVFVAGLYSPQWVTLTFALAGGYLLFWLATRPSSTLLQYNRLPDISYGVYLYAWPLNKLIMQFHLTNSLFATAVLVLLTSIVAGLLSWYLVEKPALSHKP